MFRSLAVLVVVLVAMQPTLVTANTAANASTVTVVVVDVDGKPIKGAAIEIAKVGTESVLSGKTADSGVAKFSGIDPGKYNVTATAPGFNAGSRSIEVSSGVPVTVRLGLGKGLQVLPLR